MIYFAGNLKNLVTSRIKHQTTLKLNQHNWVAANCCDFCSPLICNVNIRPIQWQICSTIKNFVQELRQLCICNATEAVPTVTLPFVFDNYIETMPCNSFKGRIYWKLLYLCFQPAVSSVCKIYKNVLKYGWNKIHCFYYNHTWNMIFLSSLTFFSFIHFQKRILTFWTLCPSNLFSTGKIFTVQMLQACCAKLLHSLEQLIFRLFLIHVIFNPR